MNHKPKTWQKTLNDYHFKQTAVLVMGSQLNNVQLSVACEAVGCEAYHILHSLALFLFFHQVRADDEERTRRLHFVLSLIVSMAVILIFIACTFRSSFQLSIHASVCLPWFCVPST